MTKDVTVDGNMTNNTTPALADRLLFVDDGTTSLQDITPDNLLKVVNLLTEDTAPDGVADYLVSYDTSASGAKKVLIGKAGGYCLQFTSANSDPADSQSYFFSNFIGSAWTTTATRRRINIPRAGQITACYITVTVGGTLGTAETATASIRLNDTSDTTVSAAVDFDAAEQVFSKTDLAIAVVAGDWITVKIAVPAWATNPTTVSINGEIWIE